MSWQLGPVVRGIRGHRSAATLVAIQFGIGLAITVLAVLIADYFRQAPVDGDAADTELTVVELQLAHGDSQRAAAALAAIERTPGCAAAAIADGLPLHSLELDSDAVSLAHDPTRLDAAAIGGGPGFARIAGMTMRSGRDFSVADLASPPVAAIVSPTFAEAMWPGLDAVGRRFQSRVYGEAIVVGVAEPTSRLFRNDSVAIYARVTRERTHLVVLARSEPGRAADLRAALADRLRAPGQHADIRPASEHMLQFARPIGPVLAILGILVVTIMLVVLMGSMGLTYFLVTSRTREIGLRRAMGATRRDTIRYFLVENAIVTIAGVVVGLAIVLAILPVLAYEQEGFTTNWPLIGATTAAVCALNSIATWIPARRAAAVPPVVASRST